MTVIPELKNTLESWKKKKKENENNKESLE
jgi:hypothetical protein